MPGKAARVMITERQQDVLESIRVSRTTPVRLIERARIILLAFEKKQSEQISTLVGLNPDQVGMWRRRWRDEFDRLVLIECQEAPGSLRKAIESVLADAHRSGRKPRISSEQQARIVAIACEQPEESDRPISAWTHREIADEAMKREIVDQVSPRRVGHFLKEAVCSPPSEVLAECEARRSCGVRSPGANRV